MTDRFDEGLMVLRRMLGWRLIDVSYRILRPTVLKKNAVNKSAEENGDVEDHPPTFGELSVQVRRIPYTHVFFSYHSAPYVPAIRVVADKITNDAPCDVLRTTTK